MGIFRVNILSSFTPYIVSHVGHLIFHGDFAQAITNVRIVAIYDNKLVPNHGQFYTLFHFDTTEKIIHAR